MALAILGVTGYTGRLVLAEARRAGLEVRLVGRRREALEELAAPGEEVRVADARDESALREAFEGVSVVASCAGPFLEIGLAPVAAAVGAGAHYLDTTGEQEFVRLDPRPDPGGDGVLPAFGFDYVPGDLAARLAAEQVEGPLDEVVVAYSTNGVGTSRGTRQHDRPRHAAAAGRLGGRPTRRLPLRCDDAQASRFPFGERTVVEWSGTEPLTVPRHTDVRNVRSYIRAPAMAAKAGAVSWLTAPVVSVASRFGPSGPVRGVPAQEPLHRRRRGARPGRGRARRPHGQRRLRPDGAPDRPRRAGADRRRGERKRRARSGGGVRRAHARRQARAVARDRE